MSTQGTSTSPEAAVTAPAPAAGRDYRYEIVIVAYRSRDLVERFLDRLPEDVPVVLVDNSHDVDGLSEVAARRAGTRYLDGPGRGYASGVNRAVAAITRRVSSAARRIWSTLPRSVATC